MKDAKPAKRGTHNIFVGKSLQKKGKENIHPVEVGRKKN